MNIFLIDYIGIHCGMHYYLEAFKKVISQIPSTNIEILSNYSENDSTPTFFINHYKGNIIKKGLSLIQNLFRLRRFIKQHPDDVFVYLTYGNSIDIYFLKIVASAKNHVIDIHEAIAQDVDNNERLKQKLKKLYADKINTVISHSSRTDDFLKEYGFHGNKLSVPHFKYQFPKDFNSENLPTEIKKALNPDKANLLFFGNLNESKGLDILMEAINLLPQDAAYKLNVIIAGKDFDGTVDKVKILLDREVHIFRRHISDDELRFLYQNVDYLALPYRKTSQSGILEMAFYFKKPIIASDVPYFRKTLKEFPSFGVLAGNSVNSYAEALSEVIRNHGKKDYYHESDYNHYENRAETIQFIKDFERHINAINS